MLSNPTLLPTLLTKITSYTPVMVKFHLKLIPQILQNKLIDKILNTLFLESLQEDELDFLEGKALKISVPDIDYFLVLTNVQQRLFVATHMTPDVTLSANFNDLMLMISREQDPDTLFFQRRLCIEGNTALGLGIKNWLDGIDLSILPKQCQRLLTQYAKAVP